MKESFGAIDLNTPEEGSDVATAIESEPGKESPEDVSALAAEIAGEVNVNEALLEENIRQVLPTVSQEERDAILQNLQTPEGQEKLQEAVHADLTKSRSSRFVARAASLLGEMGTKSLVKHAIEMVAGATLSATLVGGAAAGAGVEVFYEVRKQRKEYLLPEIIDQLQTEQDPVKRAAIVSQQEKILEQAKEAGDSVLEEELTNALRVAEVILEASNNTTEFRNNDQEISYLLSLSKSKREKYPKPVSKQAEQSIKEINEKITNRELDIGKLAEAALKGALVGMVGGTIARGIVAVGGANS